MKAYVFPGQGAQFVGMGKDLYENSSLAKALFNQANEILGFNITELMFNGTDDDLKQTKVTQPSIYLHSVILAKILGNKFKPEMVAGHSLGEYSALVAINAMNFKDGLKLVSIRAMAMQKACEIQASAMAAIIGLDDDIIEKVCNEIYDIVIPANYNSPRQLVISGSITGINQAIEKLKALGAKIAIKLQVSGAFHSQFMEPAKIELEQAINNTNIVKPICPIYQNVTANATSNPNEIKLNLIAQLTSPVRWTQTVKNMISDGVITFTEVGPGKVLQGLIKKTDNSVKTESATI